MQRLRFLAMSAAIFAGVLVSTPTSGYVFINSTFQPTLDSRAAVRLPFREEFVTELQMGRPSAPLTDGFESFDDVYVQALVDWNAEIEDLAGAPQLFIQSNSTALKGPDNGRNNAFFDRTHYGMAFPEDAVAIALRWSRQETPGYVVATESDVVFNSGWTWDSYVGEAIPGKIDFYRVALHEAGHVFGLHHPDEASPRQTREAVMNSREATGRDRLQEDDQRGIRALYSLEPPGAPRSVSATASGSVITVNWNHPATGGEPTGYMVELGTAPNQTSQQQIVGTPITSFALNPVNPGTYHVRLKGLNWAGPGPASSESVVVVNTGCTRPGTPTAVVLRNVGSTLELGWTVPSGNPTRYIMYSSRAGRVTDDNLSSATVMDLGSAATQTFTNVEPGTIYIRIKAQNSCGVGPLSNELVVTVTPAPTQQDVVYSGLFNGTFQQVLRESRGTCTWQFRYSGRMTLTLRVSSDGRITSGTARLSETTMTFGTGASNNSGLRCDPGTFSDDRSATVTGSTTDLRWSDSRWSFSGRQSGSSVTGTLTATRNDGGRTNTGSVSVTLPRQ